VAHQQIRIPTSQGETFAIASGADDAPPLLLFHGASGNTVTWMPDVRAFAGRFRVYAIDMIGEPGLSAPSRPPLSSDAYSLWLDEVLRGVHRSHINRRSFARRVARSRLRYAASRTGGTHRGTLPGRDWTAEGWHGVRHDRNADVCFYGKACHPHIVTRTGLR